MIICYPYVDFLFLAEARNMNAVQSLQFNSPSWKPKVIEVSWEGLFSGNFLPALQVHEPFLYD